MPLLADPIVDTLITEFEDTVDNLVAGCTRRGGICEKERIEVIRQLCELSRDCRLHLGPPEYAVPEQVERLAICLEKSVSRIKAQWSSGPLPEEVGRYCQNILDRARRCRS